VTVPGNMSKSVFVTAVLWAMTAMFMVSGRAVAQEKAIDASCTAPTLPLGGRQLNVYPEDSRGKRFRFAGTPEGRREREERYLTFLGLGRALTVAEPGDIIVLHKGTYRIEGGFRLDKSGEPGKYIRILGGVDGDTIIQAADDHVTVFDLGASKHLWFEGLMLKGGRAHLSASGGASDIVIRRCTSAEATVAIEATSEAAEGWHVADNVIRGRAGAGTGIHLAGRNQVVCYNRLSGLAVGIRGQGKGVVCNNDLLGCAVAIAGETRGTFRVERNRVTQPGAGPELGAGAHYGPRAFNRVIPRDFIVDAPTLENLGFRWYIDGDENRNAKVEVAFRKKGEQAWREALPMLRVQNEVVEFHYPDQQAILCGNLFAGSVLSLQPGMEYEVRFTMTDPDGGAPAEPKVVIAATRDVPRAFEGGRKLHLYPEGYAGKRESESYTDIMAAYKAAQPGDILLFHAGVYQTSSGYRLQKSGAPGKPIVFRGGIDGEATIEAKGDKVTLLSVDGTDHLWFEQLTFKNAYITLTAGRRRGDAGASDIVVRRCKILGSRWGISTASQNSKNWYLSDNVVVGHWDTWYPLRTTSYSGLRVYGQGHVLCYNRVSLTGDGVNVAQGVRPSPDIYRQCVNIDIYNNDIFDCMDNHIETDGGCHNIRVYRNRLRDAHESLSAQPTYGGPIYFIRNEIYNTFNGWKLNRNPAGCVIYNNTTCAVHACSPSTTSSNVHTRNNIFFGGRADQDASIVRLGSLTPYSTFDHDAFRYNEFLPNARKKSAFVMFYTGSRPYRVSYRYFREGPPEKAWEKFVRATGQEQHGMLADYDVFVKALPPERGATYNGNDYDLQLRASAKVLDRGVVLPQVTDGYTGAAPDLGAHEFGRPPPYYGPRRPATRP